MHWGQVNCTFALQCHFNENCVRNWEWSILSLSPFFWIKLSKDQKDFVTVHMNRVFFFISYTIQYKEESMATCVELLAPRYRAAWVRNRRRAHSTADSCLSGTDSSPRCAAAPRMWPVCVWSALKLDQSNNYLLVRSDFFKMKTGIKITFVVRSLKSR